MLYLAWCAAVDFYFAILPWIFIWELNMRFKEKMTIAISLSLGFMSVFHVSGDGEHANIHPAVPVSVGSFVL